MGGVMQVPSLFRRIVAFGIDSWIAGLFFLPVWIQLMGSLIRVGQMEVEIQWLLVCYGMQFLYSWFFLYFLGGTLGKLMMGLRVVPARDPQVELGLFQSFLRVLTDQLSLFFGQALRALALVRLDRTHVSDWVAETRVVQLKPVNFKPRRHVLLALFIGVMSLTSQFREVDRIIQRVEFSEGRVIFLQAESEI
jgi:uncharacterized RDD family membrane protein YckC